LYDSKIAVEHDKKIALAAHDNKKQDLVEWAKYNRDLLAHHDVYATGTTGQVLERELGFEITKLQNRYDERTYIQCSSGPTKVALGATARAANSSVGTCAILLLVRCR